MSSSPSPYVSAAWRPGLFTDKVLFCTGGAGSICSYQVGAFVALGGNAYIVGRNAEKTRAVASELARARPGSRVIGQAGVDVRDPASVREAAERCARELGGIDFAIAGAAGNFLAPLAELSANAFRTVMEIDALGSFYTAKAVLPFLAESAARNRNTGEKNASPGGRMVFVSASLHYTGTPLQAHAMAAKAAVDQISASVAIEYGPRGVTSNVITPGPIAGTEGMERLAKQDVAALKASQKGVPLGRWGERREIADATVFLFSDAGGFVNGHVLVVDGGHWRVAAPSSSSGFAYPDFLLSGAAVEGVKSGRRETSKL